MSDFTFLQNVANGDLMVIKQISQSGKNFNKQMAQYLMKSCTSSQNLELIIDCMKTLHKFYTIHTSENRTLELSFYEAYDYIQISPLFANAIPHIDIPSDCMEKYATTPTKRYAYLCKRSSLLSEEIAELCVKIERLECDKRQPLELFDLQMRYEDLKNQYNEICKEQCEVFENIQKKYK